MTTHRSILSAAQPSWVTASHALSHADLLATIEHVRATCSGRGLSGDVESLAVLRAVDLLAGDASRNIGRAVNRAVKTARADVASALSDSPAPVESDVLADVLADDTRTTLQWSRITSPASDVRYRVTLSDLARAIGDCLPDAGDAGKAWRDTVRAYLSHSRETCEGCAAGGRLPSLATVLTHTRRIGKESAEYWQTRRLVESARVLAGPRVLALVREYSGPGSRNIWTDDTRALADALAEATRGDRTRDYCPLSDAPRALALLITETVEHVETVTVSTRGGTKSGPIPSARWDALADRSAETAARKGYADPLVDMPRPSEGQYRAGRPSTVTRTRTLARTLVTGTRPGTLPDADALAGDITVTRVLPDGTRESYRRPVTDAEALVLASRPAPRGPGYDGESYGESSHRANTPDALTGAVPSGKAPAPRRKGARGTTGPTVPVRLN